jgi:hypothetical protein
VGNKVEPFINQKQPSVGILFNISQLPNNNTLHAAILAGLPARYGIDPTLAIANQ